jgi:hypothetical protein
MDDALFSSLGVGGQVHALEGLIPGIWPATGLFIAPQLSCSSSSAAACLPEFNEAFAGIEGIKPSSVSITINLTQAGNERTFEPVIRRLCKDSWGFVSAWKQSCTYTYSVPYAKTVQELQNHADPKPFVVNTTVYSDLKGVHTQHMELVSSRTLAFSHATAPLADKLIRYRTLPRRPWSTKEDAANALSDVFMSHVGVSQLGRPSSTCPAVPIDLGTVKAVRESLAAKGMAYSEHWLNHQSVLDDALRQRATTPHPPLPAPFLLEAVHTQPVPANALPQVCNPQSVTMAFEKTFTGALPLVQSEWTTLLHSPHMFALPLEWKVTLSTSSTRQNFTLAERSLFAALQGEAVDPGCASSIKIEITNAAALIRNGANPVWLAMRLWMGALYVTGIEHIQLQLRALPTTQPAAALPAAITPASASPASLYADLWRAGFLCRVWRFVNQDTISKRWSAAQKTACDLSNDRLFSRNQDIFRHWGPLFEAELKDEGKETHELLNVSGAMPRLYKHLKESNYVLRPKLVLVRKPVKWSWDFEERR